MSDINDLYEKIKVNIKDFIEKIGQETDETKEAYRLLVDSIQNGTELTLEQKKQIGEQLKDVLKTLGIVGITLLPGGSIFLILTKILKLNKYVLPSSFQDKK